MELKRALKRASIQMAVQEESEPCPVGACSYLSDKDLQDPWFTGKEISFMLCYVIFQLNK